MLYASGALFSLGTSSITEDRSTAEMPKQRMKATVRPKAIIGRTTRSSTPRQLAPSVRAASTWLTGTLCRAISQARKAKGKPRTEKAMVNRKPVA